jgi:hypothetical protein
MKAVRRLKILHQISGCSASLSLRKTNRDLERTHCLDRWARAKEIHLLR